MRKVLDRIRLSSTAFTEDEVEQRMRPPPFWRMEGRTARMVRMYESRQSS